MEKVLIIGGNGFVGGNVAKHLLREKYEVDIYDMKNGRSPDVKYFVGNVLNDSNFEKIIKQYTVIVYLISAIMPQKSMDEPMSSYTTDIPLLIHTLETCKANGVKRIVYASSGGTIYGDNTEANKEDKLPEPINHYAICKLSCEKILCLYNELFGMENIILRLANPYGEGQKLESGVGAITTFARHILKHEDIVLYGDGENVRDYINIADVAEAFRLAIEWKFKKEISPIFNVGSGMKISINRIVQIISEELHIRPRIEYMPQRKFDVRCNYLNMEKIHRILGLKNNGKMEESIRKYVQMLKRDYIESEEKREKIKRMIPIVMTTDDNYAFQTSVTIASILDYKSQEDVFSFFILNDGSLLDESKSYIESSIMRKENCEIHYIMVDVQHFKNIILSSHVHMASYYRLFIGELLCGYDKCLFIDGDTLIRTNLVELYDTQLDDNYIAAALDGGIQYRMETYRDYGGRIGIPSMENYFNAGVLVMNLEKIRKDNLLDKFIKHMNNNYSMMDQDVLNVCCFGKFKRLSLQYNLFNEFYNDISLLNHTNMEKRELEEAEKEAKIIHFAGEFKPWKSIGYKNADIWWNYAKQFAHYSIYAKYLEKAKKEYRYYQWKYVIEKCENKKIAILGYTKTGKRVFDQLKRAGIDGVQAFCDNNTEKQGKKYMGVTVESITNICQIDKDIVFLITNQNYYAQIYEQLIEEGVCKENIVRYIRKDASYYERLDKRYYQTEVEELFCQKYGDIVGCEKKIEEIVSNLLENKISLVMWQQEAEG